MNCPEIYQEQFIPFQKRTAWIFIREVFFVLKLPFHLIVGQDLHLKAEIS